MSLCNFEAIRNQIRNNLERAAREALELGKNSEQHPSNIKTVDVTELRKMISDLHN